MTEIVKPFTKANPLPKAGSWERPVPFQSHTDCSLPYPIEALPALIRNAVTAYHAYSDNNRCH